MSPSRLLIPVTISDEAPKIANRPAPEHLRLPAAVA